MGNSVSADVGFHGKTVGSNANPPPECPMHKKTAPPPPTEPEKKADTSKPSECPVQHGSDINPYNMVCNQLTLNNISNAHFIIIQPLSNHS